MPQATNMCNTKDIDIILKIHNFHCQQFCINKKIIIPVYEIPISEVLLVTGLSLKAALLYSGTQERERKRATPLQRII